MSLCRRALLVAVLATAAACPGRAEPGAYGAACTSDDDCRSHLCISASERSATGNCTRSCATDDECPRGHSCRGATNKGVVVCLPGPSVPF